MLSRATLLSSLAFSAVSAVGCAGAPGAVPRDVPQTFSAESELHVGTYTTCIVDGGKPVCFAVDSSEGSYDEAQTRRPAELGFLGAVKRFAFNGSYGCAITEDDKVACFEGSLGGELKAYHKAPYLDDKLGPPVMIAAGGDGFTNFGCVADAEHRVDCFSDALGPSPGSLPADTKLVQMSTGRSHMCGVTPEGGVLCWGSRDFGETGHEGYDTRAVEGLPGKALETSAGAGHSCARLEKGEIFCWGKNDSGQLGTGKAVASSSKPEQVRGLSGAVRSIALGGQHSCALLESGSVECWGRNTGGVLGDGTDTDRAVPTGVLGISDGLAIGVGQYQTCILRKGGKVTCFGMSEVMSGTFRLGAREGFMVR